MKHHSLKVSEFKDISRVEAKAALKTLTGMLRLFKDGKRWIKGDAELNGSYCLVGARAKVDGLGENLAQCIMLQALTNDRYRMLSTGPVLTCNEFQFEVLENNHDQLETAGFIPIEDLFEYEESITDFNDADSRKFSDIKTFLNHCIGFTERLVASKS